MKKVISVLFCVILIFAMTITDSLSSGAVLTASELSLYKTMLSFCYEHSYTDGSPDLDQTLSKYALIDIDGDHHEEVIVKLSNGIMAYQKGIIFSAKNNDIKQTDAPYYIDSVYRGGYVKALVSHNQGPSLTFWPYSVFRYNNNSLQLLFSAYCVDKEADPNGRFYQESLDVDHDGVIYYIDDRALTKAEFYAYVNRYMPAANKLNVRWFNFTRKNINNLSAAMISQNLAAPKITKLSNYPSGVKLTWNRVSGAKRYRVFIKNGSSWVKLGDTTGTSFVHKAAKSGKKYAYTVRCLSADGKAYASNYYTKGWSTTFVAAPAPPVLRNTKNGVQISWKRVPGAANYRVYRSTDNGKTWKAIANSVRAVVDKTAKNGVTYRYTIRCLDKNGKCVSGYNTGTAIKCKR